MSSKTTTKASKTASAAKGKRVKTGPKRATTKPAPSGAAPALGPAMSPYQGINGTIDAYILAHDKMSSMAFHCMIRGLAAAEMASLYQRAAFASAQGRNNDRDSLMAEAEKIADAFRQDPERG